MERLPAGRRQVAETHAVEPLPRGAPSRAGSVPSRRWPGSRGRADRGRASRIETCGRLRGARSREWRARRCDRRRRRSRLVGSQEAGHQSNSVLLPDPLGPISPTTVPGAISNEQAPTARRPPNRLVRPARASFGGRRYFLSHAYGGTGTNLPPAAAATPTPGRSVPSFRPGSARPRSVSACGMPLGQGRELARAPRRHEGGALECRLDLLGVEAARLLDRIEHDQGGVVRLHREVGRIRAGLLLVGRHHGLRHLGVLRRPPSVVDDGEIHLLGVLVDEGFARSPSRPCGR